MYLVSKRFGGIGVVEQPRVVFEEIPATWDVGTVNGYRYEESPEGGLDQQPRAEEAKHAKLLGPAITNPSARMARTVKIELPPQELSTRISCPSDMAETERSKPKGLGQKNLREMESQPKSFDSLFTLMRNSFKFDVIASVKAM